MHLIVNHPALHGLIAIMPDAHAGSGCVIGFTGKFHNAVIPNIVGVNTNTRYLCSWVAPYHSVLLAYTVQMVNSFLEDVMKKQILYKGYNIEKTDHGVFHVTDDNGGYGFYRTLAIAKIAIDRQFLGEDYIPED